MLFDYSGYPRVWPCIVVTDTNADRAARWQPTLFEKVWLLGKEFAGGGSA